jgi:predicted dithiol-disulfide oxidoreductase (DUF899 family)
MIRRGNPLGEIASPAEWQAAGDKLLVKEQELTARSVPGRGAAPAAHGLDRGGGQFEGPDGTMRLLDPFQARRKLLVYHSCSHRRAPRGRTKSERVTETEN